jgi:hypothetical protein
VEGELKKPWEESHELRRNLASYLHTTPVNANNSRLNNLSSFLNLDRENPLMFQHQMQRTVNAYEMARGKFIKSNKQ